MPTKSSWMLPRLTTSSLVLCLLSLGWVGSVPAQEAFDGGQFDDIDFTSDEFEQFGDDDFGSAELSTEEEAAIIAIVGAVWIGIFIMVGISFLVMGLVAYLMMDALNAIPEQFRQLSPMVPWLLFVPLVNLVVIFLVFIKVPESLSTYLQSAGDTSQGDCGKAMGLWGTILYIIGCTFPVGLVLMVISMIKIGNAKKLARSLQM